MYKQIPLGLMKYSLLGLLFQLLTIAPLFAGNGDKTGAAGKVKLSMRLDDASVRQAFAVIEDQTAFRFAYDQKDVDKNVKLHLSEGEYLVSQALDEISRQANLSFKQINNTIYVKKEMPKALHMDEITPVSKRKLADVAALASQDLTVSGQVTSQDDNSPLPGVNVVIRGTSSGTTTDVDGRYSLQVPDETAVLVFSYIGFTTEEIPVGSRSVINVSLTPDIKQLSEIVVVGYGEQRRREVTGSVTKIEMEGVETQPNTNLTQALRGKVAGVQFLDNGRPGQSGQILIRGQRSITAGNDPLIVLDGAFFNGEMADINPNDIESMEILKDASAAAIYGSRAANGVILITSKRGDTEKPVINFNTYYGVSDWSYKINLFSPERYLQRRADFMEQNNITPDPSNPYDLEANELEMYNAGRTIDPWEAVSQNANQQSYNLSVSGRTERTNYFLSGSFVEEEGLIYGDRASRLSTRLNLENQITDWLNVGINGQFAQRDQSGINADLADAYWLSPYAKLYRDEAETDLVYYPVFGETLVNNPLFNAKTMDNEEVSNNLFANLFALIDFPFVEGLSYRLNYNPNIRWERDYAFWPIFEGEGVRNNGQGRKVNTNRWNWQLENILNYNREFGRHGIGVTLVYGLDHSQMESTRIDALGFPNDVNSYNNLDIAQTKEVDTEAAERDGISSMARLNYRYNERYLVTATVRRDGSSVFGENYKYGVFPSIALGWIMSDEPWMNTAFVDLLKLRASYGEVGNQSIGSYSALGRFDDEAYVFGDGSDTYIGLFPDPALMPNPNLRWESTVSANIAIDFSLFSDRLSGTLEYYDMRSNDLLLERRLPPASGFESIYTNLGETKNNGVEITLNTVNVRNEDFEWGSSVVLSSNKNRIVSLYGSDVDGDGVEDDDVGNRWFIGEPINVTYDYVFDGIYQEGDELPQGYQAGWVRVEDVDGSGDITPDDRQVLGQVQPKFRWGFNNNIAFKGLSLSFFINGMHGFEQVNNLLDVSSSKGFSYPGRSLNFMDEGYWTPENQSNTRPSLNWTNPLGLNFYQNRDFVRLQDVTLAYTFPASFMERMKIANLRVYVSGRNLATFTDWLGPDPESGYNNINNLYPTSRTIIGGVNLSF